MPVWSQKTLVAFTPTTTPMVTFYYLPLQGDLQDIYRAQYSEIGSLLDLALEALCDRVVGFSVTNLDGTHKYFQWPSTIEDQDLVLDRMPDEAVLEAGTRMLGWVKDLEEPPLAFYERVIEDIQTDKEG